MEIASHFIVEQAYWKRAAVHLRLPYWDWVSNAVPPDCVIRDETVTVLNFDGKTKWKIRSFATTFCKDIVIYLMLPLLNGSPLSGTPIVTEKRTWMSLLSKSARIPSDF